MKFYFPQKQTPRGVTAVSEFLPTQTPNAGISVIDVPIDVLFGNRLEVVRE